MVVGQVRAGGTEELLSFGLGHPEVVLPNLQRHPVRPKRLPGAAPARRARSVVQLRALRDVSRERRHGVPACRALEQMEVVEDQDKLLVHR